MTSLTISPFQGSPLGRGPTEALNDLTQPFPANDRRTDFHSVRRSVNARAQRARFFTASLFSDPAWDMLLVLYATELSGRRLAVSKLAERSGVPMTTALRWIATLEGEGLVVRSGDQFDGRRVFIVLSRQGFKAMQAYFDSMEADTIVV